MASRTQLVSEASPEKPNLNLPCLGYYVNGAGDTRDLSLTLVFEVLGLEGSSSALLVVQSTVEALQTQQIFFFQDDKKAEQQAFLWIIRFQLIETCHVKSRMFETFEWHEY